MPRNFIAARRRAKGWNQSELALEAGITQAAVSDIENGKRWPRVEQLANIAKALDCTDLELFVDPTADDLNAAAAGATEEDRVALAAMIRAFVQRRRPAG